LGIALSATAAAYGLSYARTLRKIVEEPDIVAGIRGGSWLPRFGDPLNTAIVQFSVLALLRSRLHRIVLTFYLGAGFALVIALVEDPSAQLPLPPIGAHRKAIGSIAIPALGSWNDFLPSTDHDPLKNGLLPPRFVRQR
jgi:hypothetical protein